MVVGSVGLVGLVLLNLVLNLVLVLVLVLVSVAWCRSRSLITVFMVSV